MVTYMVILNWNGLSDTRECLDSLKRVEEDIKIVVVDNASQGDDCKIIKKEHPEVILIENTQNLGYTGGNNAGIKYALKQRDCSDIMTLNNDTCVKPDFLYELKRYLNDKMVVSPKILYYGSDVIQNMGGRISHLLGGTINIYTGRPSEKCTAPVSPDLLSGCCFLASRKAFEEIGLFDEKYFLYAEDLDWSFRARKKGYELIVLPRSIIWHKHSKSNKESFKKVYFIARNHIYFARKNLGGIKKIIFILAGIFSGFILNVIRQRNITFIPHYLKGIKDGFHM